MDSVIAALADALSAMLVALWSAATWMWAERNWLFPGVGVLAVTSLLKWREQRRKRTQSTESGAHTSVPSSSPRQQPNAIRRASPESVSLPWHLHSDDPVGVIADAILSDLRDADGRTIYVNPSEDVRGTALQLQEAIARLRKSRMIDVYTDLGVSNYLHLDLTPTGRTFVLSK